MTVKQLMDVLKEYPEGVQVETMFESTDWVNTVDGFDLEFDEATGDLSTVILVCNNKQKPKILPDKRPVPKKLNLSDWKKHWL